MSLNETISDEAFAIDKEPEISNDDTCNVVTLVGHVVAPLSMVGSLLTMFTLFRCCQMDRNFRLATYHRLLLGISVFDLIFSFAFALFTVPLPRDGLGYTLQGGMHNIGTQGTCTAQGFLLTAGLGSFTYNLMLMFYFQLVIQFNMKDALVRSWFEPVMHFVSIGFFTGAAIWGLFHEVYNPIGAFCWVSGYPFACDYTDTCTRGQQAAWFLLWFIVVPLIAVTFLLGLCLCSLVLTVSYRAWRRQRFSFDNNFGYGGNREEEVAYRRSKLVITQSFLYGITLVNAMVWSTVGGLTQIKGTSQEFYKRQPWIHSMAALFFPVQGFINFLIFIRPRYMVNRGINVSHRARRRRPLSRFWSLWEAVMYPVNNHSRNMSSTPPTDLSTGSDMKGGYGGDDDDEEESSVCDESLSDEPKIERSDDDDDDDDEELDDDDSDHGNKSEDDSQSDATENYMRYSRRYYSESEATTSMCSENDTSSLPDE